MKATSGDLPLGRGLDLRGEVGRHAGAVLRRRRPPPGAVLQRARRHGVVARAGRAARRAPGHHRAARRRAGGHRRRGPARLRAASSSACTSPTRPRRPAGAAEVPVSYVVFDLLHLDGHDLTGLPLADRRRLLDQVLEPAPAVALLAAARRRPRAARGRRRSAASRGSWPSGSTPATSPGKRTRTWLKVKVRHRQEMVVGGWLPGEGNRAGRIGALLVGYHDAAGRRPAALRRPGRHRLQGGRAAAPRRPVRRPRDRRLPLRPAPAPRPRSCAGPTWVRPELVAELSLRRVDGRRPPPAPELPRPAGRQGGRGRHPRCLTIWESAGVPTAPGADQIRLRVPTRPPSSPWPPSSAAPCAVAVAGLAERDRRLGHAVAERLRRLRRGAR